MIKRIKFKNSARTLLAILGITLFVPISAMEMELSLTPFGEPTFLGLALGVSRIDIGTEKFNKQGQDIAIDLNDSSSFASIFFVVPINRTMGAEFTLSQIGRYSFTGVLSGNQNIGTVDGEQTYQGLGLNAYYQKSFEHFATRVHFGVVQTRIVTEGYLDIIGKANQSINHSENSTNAYLSLETNKTVFKDWTLGPALSFLKSSDPIQIFSLKLSKELKN